MKISKKIRQLNLIEFLIKKKRNTYGNISNKITTLYLKTIRKYNNIEYLVTVGKGASFYVLAYKNQQKFFIKISNRRRSKKNEVKGYLNYHKNNSHFIKLVEYKYFLLINYICFEYVEFKTLYEFEGSVNYKNKFPSDLLLIVENLYNTKTNHNDISDINIGIIRDGNCLRLELFDFGVMEVNHKNFEQLFLQDLSKLHKIAETLLDKDGYDIFYNGTLKYLK